MSFKVGDKVAWSGKEGVVVSIHQNDADFPILVDFGHPYGELSFTDKGKSRYMYLLPSLKLMPNLTEETSNGGGK